MPFALKTWGLLAATAVTLSGCFITDAFSPRRVVEYPPYEGTDYSERDWTEREKLLARSDFSVELVHFEDDRRPRSTAFSAPDEVIYEYEPDELMQGLTYKVPVLINKYMTFRPKMEKHYMVEISLKRLQTRIITGNLWSGKFGRYQTHLEARALARRPDSMIAVNRPYEIKLTEKRETFNGRPPTKEMDRARMYDLTEDAFRRLAEEIAWDLRQNDARTWEVEPNTAPPPAAHIRPTNPQPPVVFDEDEPTTIEELVGPEEEDDTPAPLEDNGLRV